MTPQGWIKALIDFLIGVVVARFAFGTPANAQWFYWPRHIAPQSCANGRCARPSKSETKKEPEQKEPTEPEPAKESPASEVVEAATVARSRFSAPSVEIADACDEILDRLETRYGKPKNWKPFPVYFRQYLGNGVAGYTQYTSAGVAEVVVYEPLSSSVGGTLDHELTHAFFFYFLGGNFDLFLNEGAAQNSEYRRREALRQTVYKRYNAGEFWDIASLYGRNQYDGGLRIYHEGFSIVDFLIGRGGSSWFAAFLEDLQKSKNIDATLSRFYGYANLNELQNAWLIYVLNGQNRNDVRAVK